jgi:hypothetical protein
MLDGFGLRDVNYGVLVGNLATYGIMAGLFLGWLIYEALSALRASLPGLRPMEEAHEAPTALLEAEAVEAEALFGDNGSQPLPVDAVSHGALVGLQLTDGDNGIDVAHAGESLIGSTTQEQ